MQREDKIYMAYRLKLASRKKTDAHTAEILSLLYTAKAFKISLFAMMDIVKNHKR